VSVEKRKYPIVACDGHPGEDEPGYIVCQHVLEGSAVSHFEPATSEKLGTVACRICWTNIDIDCFNLCCAHAVRDHGWDQPKARVQ